MRNQKMSAGFTMPSESAVQNMVDALDVAAKQYGAEALAERLVKASSTLRNELAGVPGHKLALSTAILIMVHTGDLRALDRIEEMFGRVGIPLPKSTRKDPAPLLAEEGKLAKEFGEHVAVMGAALMDGTVEASEAAECIEELDDVVRKAMEIRAHLEVLADGEV